MHYLIDNNKIIIPFKLQQYQLDCEKFDYYLSDMPGKDDECAYEALAVLTGKTV